MDSLLAPNYAQEDNLSRSPHIHHFDVSPSLGTPYDSFDYPQDNPHFPRTPSYNGSYQNSPYSTASELPPALDLNEGLGLLDSANPSGFSFTREYDPDDYDIPHSSGALLSFDDEFMPSIGPNSVSVSVTPPMYDHSSPNAFDHSSPASSNGAEEEHRSRASSTSSYIHPNSPRLDLPQNFERLQFDSPHWSATQLPDRYSPPHKPQSPPQLLIPASPSGTRMESPPIINAPDGDGVMHSGPQLHIVPATPVSGGGETVQNVPFLGAYPLIFLLSSKSARLRAVLSVVTLRVNSCRIRPFPLSQVVLRMSSRAIPPAGIRPSNIRPRKGKIKLCPPHHTPITHLSTRSPDQTTTSLPRGCPMPQQNHRCLLPSSTSSDSSSNLRLPPSLPTIFCFLSRWVPGVGVYPIRQPAHPSGTPFRLACCRQDLIRIKGPTPAMMETWVPFPTTPGAASLSVAP